MKAAAYTKYGPPEVIEIRDMETPAPAEGEVLIRVRAATVGATDPIDRRGDPFIARLATGLLKPKYPVLGSYLAGEIEEVGIGVTRFKPGDSVFAATGIGLGAHAEYRCLPADGAIALQPAGLAHAQAAAVADGALTALPFLRDHAKIRAGQQVLVIGASGSVGSAAVQLARHFGAEVTGVCSGTNHEMVEALGAGEVIDYTREDFTQNGRKYDVIFDAVGVETFPRCSGSLKPGGVYLTTVPSLGILFHMARTARSAERRAVFAATGLRPATEKGKDLVFLKGLVEAGAFTPVIDRRFPLEKIAEAHRYVETGRKRGNVILSIG